MEKYRKKKVAPKWLFIFVLLVFVFSVFPIVASAASLSLSPSTGSYNVNQTFQVGVFVSSTAQPVNAYSGVISFTSTNLEVVSISQVNSIVSFWAQEPSFSNTLGRINFEGVTFNPGFQGTGGRIITITFRAKAAGSAVLSFIESTVLAADGLGTNILKTTSGANYNIGQRPIIEPEPESVVGKPPEAPIITSPTHPEEDKWYSNNNPKFTWEVPKDITGTRLLVNQNPISTPNIVYLEPISEKQFKDLADGIWYFHVQLRNKSGWGGTSHFKFQIDTQPPKPFEIRVKEGKNTINPRPTLVFEATDEMSGIDYYEVKIDQKPSTKIKEKEYQIPAQTLGTHIIIVKAVDKAGNETLAMTEINILPIETPIITDYSQTLFPGAILSIKGTAAPENKIEVYIQKNKEEPKIEETKSDKEGKWSYIGTESLEKGVYKIWVEAIDSIGAKSEPSEKVTIQVVPPAFIRIGQLVISYLTTVITLLVLIFAMVLAITWSWRKIAQKRKKLRKEITKVEKVLYHAFKALKEETEEQVAKLDGKPNLSEREKKICDELKKALKISEKLIGKEIQNIEKELY